ncbi:MAG: hypothetical protein JSU90_08425 [Nitrospiraceae bacterium]|nr:MAG: hypothetical protein JSU90_08425 [Nitrospiraceae bacterium]
MKTGFIDWTETALNLYTFEKRGSRFILTGSSSIALEGDLTAETLRTVPSREWSSVFLSVPIDSLTLREETFPFSEKTKIRDTIPYELDGILLGSVSDYVIDHMIIETSESGSTVLAACMEKAALKNTITLFSSAGLDPKVITSLNLRLSGGRSSVLLEGLPSDSTTRAAAAAIETAQPVINLRQDEFSYLGDVQKFVKNLRMTAVLLLIFLLIIAGNAMFRLSAVKKEHAALNRELETAYHSVFPEDKRIIDAGRQFRGNMNTLMKKRDSLSGIPVLDILRDIAQRNKRTVTLHDFSVDGKNIIIKGTANSFKDVEAIKNDFLSVYKTVNVSESGASADRKVSFTLVMQERKV